MDQKPNLPVKRDAILAERVDEPWEAKISRRRAIEYGLSGLACVACGGAAVYYAGHYVREKGQRSTTSAVFKGDAPEGELWQQWQQRGWVKEARHYLQLGRNIQCKLCPNECVLEPGDRSHCRNRVNKDGTLFTLAYGNPCAFHVDPIEKKPLFHFLPGTPVFSLATAGCGFRCLNCQNWDISQRKPEETKDPRGEPLELNPQRLQSLDQSGLARASIFPDDVVALSEHFQCPSIAYTYSEPVVWYEYMIDIAKAARQRKLKSAWITCGYIQEKPLVELCRYIDAANVNLKSFSEEIYSELNSGKLEPILATLKILKREGVWFEVTNLVVPTYTDKPDMMRRMCDWLLDNLGPDYPLHFSRFHSAHKLTHLPPTPVAILAEAYELARAAGLRYVYVGNCSDVPNAEDTFCPHCKKAVIQRQIFSVEATNLHGGKCGSCGTQIAGVWSTG